MQRVKTLFRKRFFKPSLYFIVPLTLLGGYQLYLKQNGGFATWKIPAIALEEKALNLPSEELIQSIAPSHEEIQKVLSQKFTFLGRGGQSFAFIGEDDETVLKIFKNYRYKNYDILHHLPVPNYIQELINTGMEVRHFKLNRFYKGCVIAAYEIPEETQVSYIHIFPSNNLNIQLELKDPLGFTHHIDADSIQFLLQKKLKVADDVAKELIEKGDEEGFYKMLLATEKMMHARFLHGIVDSDFAFDKNVGFLNEKAILLDFGSILKLNTQDPKGAKELALYLREELNRFERLTSRRYPEAIAWIEHFFKENPSHLEFRDMLERSASKEPSNRT